MNARYARFYSNGSTVNGANHYVEIEVYGVEPQFIAHDVDGSTPIIDFSTISVSKAEVTVGEAVVFRVNKTAGEDYQSIIFALRSPITNDYEEIPLYLNNGIYEGTFSVDDSKEYGLWKVGYIWVYTLDGEYLRVYNNEMYGTDSEDLSKGDFTVYGTNPVIKVPETNENSLRINTQNVGLHDTVEYSLYDINDIGSSAVTVYLQSPITSTSHEVVLTYDEVLQKYTGSLTIDDKKEAGVWQIRFIEYYDKNSEFVRIYNSQFYSAVFNVNLSSGNFFVDANPGYIDLGFFDVGSLRISDNQLVIGDTVKFSIKAQEWADLNNVIIDLRSPDNKIHTISLNYNEEMDIYVGEFYLSAYAELGAWSINMLQAFDSSGGLIRVYNDDRYSGDSDDLSAGNFDVI
ncbi:hypothetical protein SDC9_123189 [bioreactor metagenome]|uniref:F5/8 type C domain-containing protein n=1 Tax=bioreactor metagenome TaxID=1076179 RepID=A0A645CH36_9ZZZZ